MNCHPRALVLLAREVSRQGVRATTNNLQHLMVELHQKHPDDRENSLYASVELSLRRLSPALRQQIQALAVFQGGAHLGVLGYVLEVDADIARSIAIALIDVGLGADMGYGWDDETHFKLPIVMGTVFVPFVVVLRRLFFFWPEQMGRDCRWPIGAPAWSKRFTGRL